MTILVTLSACGRSAADPVAVTPGSVGIGGGRTLFMNCQGAGAPTVFVIPGLGSYAEVWNHIVAPDDPSWASPYDDIEMATLVPSLDATQPTVARTTRICSYDRPDTRPDGANRSTPVPQPHSMQHDVDDVVALIDAAGLQGPIVFVAHSYGGLVLDLLARRHPELVAGLVFVEPTSEFLPGIANPAQNAAFYLGGRDGRAPGESVWFEEAFAAVAAAPPLPRVPALVLSADRFAPPEQLTPDNYTQAQIHRANDMLATALGATNVLVSGSGHNVMLYQPQAVADAVVDVVDRVRASDR
jgi:pimeloyl-ACP methyl ester carboxylesterase